MSLPPQLQKFLLIIGNARSGSTILGAALDAHPEIVVANETKDSASFWRDLDGAAIFDGIMANAEHQAATGRLSSGYEYQMGLAPSSKHRITVIGDKIWNPSTLLLHGDYELIPSLETKLGVPIVVIHAVRNLFDTVTTMHRRSGAPISDRLRWFSAHCEAVAAIKERLPSSRFLDLYHEDLLLQPEQELTKCCRFLGVPVDAQHIERVRKTLFKEPHATRNHAHWSESEVGAARAVMERFQWLQRYSAKNTPDCKLGGS